MWFSVRSYSEVLIKFILTRLHVRLDASQRRVNRAFSGRELECKRGSINHIKITPHLRLHHFVGCGEMFWIDLALFVSAGVLVEEFFHYIGVNCLTQMCQTPNYSASFFSH